MDVISTFRGADGQSSEGRSDRFHLVTYPTTNAMFVRCVKHDSWGLWSG